MINQFLSNLSFSPALIEEVGSHIKNAKREKRIRFLGLIFLSLNLLVILFAANIPHEVVPPSTTPTEGFSSWFYEFMNSMPDISPSTGIAWALTAVIVSSYFYIRNQLIGKELSILRRIFLNNGSGRRDETKQN